MPRFSHIGGLSPSLARPPAGRIGILKPHLNDKFRQGKCRFVTLSVVTSDSLLVSTITYKDNFAASRLPVYIGLTGPNDHHRKYTDAAGRTPTSALQSYAASRTLLSGRPRAGTRAGRRNRPRRLLHRTVFYKEDIQRGGTHALAWRSKGLRLWHRREQPSFFRQWHQVHQCCSRIEGTS